MRMKMLALAVLAFVIVSMLTGCSGGGADLPSSRIVASHWNGAGMVEAAGAPDAPGLLGFEGHWAIDVIANGPTLQGGTAPAGTVEVYQGNTLVPMVNKDWILSPGTYRAIGKNSRGDVIAEETITVFQRIELRAGYETAPNSFHIAELEWDGTYHGRNGRWTCTLDQNGYTLEMRNAQGNVVPSIMFMYWDGLEGFYTLRASKDGRVHAVWRIWADPNHGSG